MRYRVVGDNSGHSYFIPLINEKEWIEFMNLDEDDQRSWDVPIFATRINGRFTFSDPRLD